MKKIQSFYIFKIASSRLKECNFRIKNLTIDDARINGEIISIADSQLVRTIHEVTQAKYSSEKLKSLLDTKRYLSKKQSSQANKNKLAETNNEIDSLLFIPEILTVFMENKSHYEKILSQGGFFVNNIHFVPFMASSGQIRRNTAFFINEKYKHVINDIFDNGRNKEKELVPAKFSAYFSLYSSSSLPVSTPRFAVVSDMTITAVKHIDWAEWVGENIDPVITEQDRELEFNAFDGQGLISPRQSKIWADELGLDYIPSTYIVRAPFVKGQLITIDFHDFADTVANKKEIVDIYGNIIPIDNVDAILSESQFKLWDSYASTNEYSDNCAKNNLGWGITKAAPKKEKDFARSSYQFLQILNLKDDDIKTLCQPTLDWLDFISGGDFVSTLLYMLGDTDFSEKGWFDRLDPVIQSLLMEKEIIKDHHLITYLDKTIAKRKNGGKFGKMIFNGGYQNIMADPYAQMCHIFKTDFSPLLGDKQHYCKYWSNRGIDKVAGIRSPAVHSSEVDILNIQNTDEMKHWYKYIASGVIFPPNGVGLDFAITGGSDGDGDQIATLNNPAFINGKVDSLPIFYETKKAPKIQINEDTYGEVYKTHIKGLNQKVGFFTNVSTSMSSLIYDFERGTPEYEAIAQRLKWGRVLQGLELDRIKGLDVPPFPAHWTKWKKIIPTMSEEEALKQSFYNRILVEKRPLFMLFLYPHYKKKYDREISVYDNFSKVSWGIPFEELLAKGDRTQDQEGLVSKYKRKTFFISNNSTMNKISKFMDCEIKKIRKHRIADDHSFDYSVLLSKDFVEPKKRDVDKVIYLYKEYKSLLRQLRENKGDFSEIMFSSREQISEYIRRKAASTIVSNSSEMADIAVYTCYGGSLGKTSRLFCWDVFGKDIASSIKNRKGVKFVSVPLPSETGKTEYLWNEYSMFYLSITED